MIPKSAIVPLLLRGALRQYATKTGPVAAATVNAHEIPHDVKYHHDNTKKQMRSKETNHEQGHVPGMWERYQLVATGLYKSTGDIPHSVPPGTMEKMKDRANGFFIGGSIFAFLGIILFLGIINRRRFMHDRDHGVVVRTVPN